MNTPSGECRFTPSIVLHCVANAVRRLLGLTGGVLLLVASAAAQPLVQAPATPHTSEAATDAVVADVDGHPIHLSELNDASPSLPESGRSMPFESIYPVLLDRTIDHEALVLLAQRQHLDDDPAVKRQIAAATARVLEAVVLERIEAPSNVPFGEIYSMLLDPMIDHENLVRQARREKLDNDPAVRRQIDATTARILEDALLQHSGVPAVTEAAIKARYARDFANQPAVETEEVRARHILVRSEAEAKRLIDELNKGADFATLVQSFSEDPDRVDGGDTGFIRRGQVIPQVGAKPVLSLEPNQISQPPGHAILPPAPVVSQEGADLVFSLKPNEVAQTPIHNAFGWHVVQVLERRRIPPKTSAQIHDEIRQQLRIEAMEPLVAKARDGLVVQKFNLNGTPMAE